MLKDPPPHEPEPLGVAVCSLPGVCASQSSGHGGGQPGGRWEGAVVLSALPGVGGLRSVVALQGLLSAGPQPPAANGPACPEKASGQSDNTSRATG